MAQCRPESYTREYAEEIKVANVVMFTFIGKALVMISELDGGPAYNASKKLVALDPFKRYSSYIIKK